ncbi:HU family DNA-binding protein [Thalassococcus sp. S3]|uniref:HU family DNA-binding protein n=1 Tax=Thalassococcus sp. S3 TaxID=2017482 RepID=UPI0013EE8602|nr:HU family DNA-binding protein [Thalassococcus sp. S3]
MTTSKSKPTTTRKTSTTRRKPTSGTTGAASKVKKTPKAKTEPVSAVPQPAPPLKKEIHPTVVTLTEPSVSAPTLRKRELLDEVVRRTEVKRKDAKKVLEETLALLGTAVAEGREINIPGFGKLMVQQVETKANARVANCKIRQSRNSGKETLAEPEKDG